MNWGKVSRGFDCVMYMLGVNLCFLAGNAMLLLFLLFVGISQAGTYLPLFLVCLLPMAPALSAVFYAMNRYLEKKDSGAFKDYRKGWKSGLFLSLKAGVLQLAFVFILWTNIRFFSKVSYGYISVVVSTVLLVLILLMTPNLYYLTGVYEMRLYGAVKAALTVTIGKPGTTLGGAAALLLLLAVFEVIPGLAVFFFAGVYGLLVVFMNRRFIGGKKPE